MRVGRVQRRSRIAGVIAAVAFAATASVATLTMVDASQVRAAAANEGCYWIYYNGWYYICPPPPPKPGGGGGGGVVVMALYYPSGTSTPTRPPSYVPPIPSTGTGGAAGTSTWECDWHWSGRAWEIPCELPRLPAGYAAVLY